MRRLFQLIGWLLVLSVAAGLLFWATNRELVRAWTRAVVIGSTISDAPYAAALTRALTREPEPMPGVVRAGALDARATRPGGRADAPHPTVVLLVPAGATADELAEIDDAQSALARAGLVAWAVRLPPATSIELGAGPAERLADALVEVAAAPTTKRGEIALFGAGAGASLGIVAAADARLDGRISAIVAVQPYADVQGVLRLIVTGTTRTTEGTDLPHGAGARLQRVAAYAIVHALERAGLDERIAGVLETGIKIARDPFEPLLRYPPRLLPERLRPVREVLSATGPGEFDRAWGDLPPALSTIAEARSPSLVVEDVDAPIIFVVPYDDSVLPAHDAQRLAALAPSGRIVRTSLIDPANDSDLTWGALQPLLHEAVELLQVID